VTHKTEGCTNLLLRQVVWEVGDHHLRFRGDAISRGAALPTLPGTGLGLAALALLLNGRLVGDILQRLRLRLSGGRLLSASDALVLLLVLLCTSVWRPHREPSE
jgi:hypothetical protein